MANCRACGGVLGRDCYNEQDCMQISEARESEPCVDVINSLQIKIQQLESIIADAGLELPYEKNADWLNNF